MSFMQKTMVVFLALLTVFTSSPLSVEAQSYDEGSLIKAKNNSTVYYIGPESKKYVFPEGKTYSTWFDDFSQIKEVSTSELDEYTDGGAMPIKGGTRLITHQNTAKVYAVEAGGILRHIPSEAKARELFGDDWASKVVDVLPGFFASSYQIGEELGDILPNGYLVTDGSKYYYIENGKKKLMSKEALRLNNLKEANALRIKNLNRYGDDESIAGKKDSLANFVPPIKELHEDKVVVCHNSHNIKISKNALKAHLAIGDTLGACTQDKAQETNEVEPNNWCSVLLGLFNSASLGHASNDPHDLLDLNNDGLFNLSDNTLAVSLYNSGNDSVCLDYIEGNYTQSNYEDLDWCNGLVQGISDNLGATNPFGPFDLNNDNNINLSDVGMVASFVYEADQAQCYSEYLPQLPAMSDGDTVDNDAQAPGVPSNLTASASGTQVSLSWTASTDNVGVAGYQILRSTSNGGPYTQQATSDTTSYSQTNLTSGVTYYYVVKAYDAAGNYSTSSNQATIQIEGGSDSCTPINITNLTSNIGTSNPQNTASVTATAGDVMYLTVGISFMPSSFPSDSITISGLGATWTKVSTNTFGYRRRVWLFRGVGGTGTGPVTINYTGVNPGSFQEIGWVLDQASGLNLATPNGSVTTVETGLNSPSILTVGTNETPSACDVTYSSLALEYQQNANVESGWSLLGQTSNGSLGVRKVASAWDDARDTNHTWSWTNSSYGTAFITILKNAVSSQAVGDTQAPTTPSNLSASASGNQVSLSWTASTDNESVYRYRIERSTSASSGFSEVATPSNNSYVNSGLNYNTTYYYRVRAEDASNNYSAYSSTVSATTGSSTTPPTGTSPSISGVSDNTISHGQTITISGSNFGTKVAVNGIVGPPVLWDDFEDGTAGALVQPSAAKWDRVRSDNTSGPRYYAGAINGSMGVRTGSGIVDGVTGGTTRTLIEDDEYRNLYLDYYIRAFKGEGLKQRSSKQVMIWSANEGISEDGPNTAFWQITQGGEEPPFAFGQYICSNDDPWINTYGNGWGVDEFTTARHVQIEYRQPSAIGVNDGHARIWYDGVLVTDQMPFGSPSCDPDRNYLDNLFIGHYQDIDSAVEPIYKWISCPGDARCDQCPAGASGCSVNNDDWLPARQDEFFYDNIYIDKSIARVEIGNAPTYAASTRREVQIPTSWGNSIQITVNSGAFTNGQTAYIYVVNSDGNVNASGYPVQIASVLGDRAESCNTPDQITLNWTSLSENTLVRGCGPAIYAIENGRRWRVPNLEVLRRDYPGQAIYNVRESLLEAYPIIYR